MASVNRFCLLFRKSNRMAKKPFVAINLTCTWNQCCRHSLCQSIRKRPDKAGLCAHSLQQRIRKTKGHVSPCREKLLNSSHHNLRNDSSRYPRRQYHRRKRLLHARNRTTHLSLHLQPRSATTSGTHLLLGPHRSRVQFCS